jgi:hypothetical protein
MPSVVAAPQSSVLRYEVDVEALGVAALFLGLLVPVKVRRCTLSSYGRYGWIDYGFHRIWLCRLSSPAKASQSLWHELGHARQLEQRGGDPWRFYDDYHRGAPPRPEYATNAFYHWCRRRPMEREVMALESNHAWLPLTRPI